MTMEPSGLGPMGDVQLLAAMLRADHVIAKPQLVLPLTDS